jgi:hypothetical protein
MRHFRGISAAVLTLAGAVLALAAAPAAFAATIVIPDPGGAGGGPGRDPPGSRHVRLHPAGCAVSAAESMLTMALGAVPSRRRPTRAT